MNRFYQNIPLKEGTEITLEALASHHLAVVLRANIGEKIALFNGDGNDYLAIISAISKKKVVATITQQIAKNTESTLHLHLAQGIARGEKMDFIVQKAVELGVKTITPLVTLRSNMRLSTEQAAKKWRHWQAIIENACEQSGRATLPLLHSIQPLTDWVKNTQGLSFVLSPHSTTAHLKNFREAEHINLLIGPEGGLDASEINTALSANFQLLKLGNRILRTETATIAALSILQYQYGDM